MCVCIYIHIYTYIYIYGSLCCTAEIGTMLKINYTFIKRNIVKITNKIKIPSVFIQLARHLPSQNIMIKY